MHWLRTVTRTWDGRFLYMQGGGNVFNYSGCSSTGANLLDLCVGRRAICLTGKEADKSLWLKDKAAEAAVEAGTVDDAKQGRESLLALLGSPLPPVRLEAAEALAAEGADVKGAVMRLLAEGNRDQRIGAIHAIGALKLTSATDALMAIVRNDKEDLWLRQLAVGTLADWDNAKPYGPELLKILVADKPYDRFRDLDRTLGFALVKVLGPDPYALGLDKDLFYKGVTKLLDHKHMWGRSAGMELIRNIPIEDLYRVADQMVYVIEDKDRTYTSYHGDGQRAVGLEILNRLNIKDAIDLALETVNEKTGRAGPRIRDRVALLKTLGAEARYAIPKIREGMGQQADAIVKGIEESKTSRKMISLEEAKDIGRKAAK